MLRDLEELLLLKSKDSVGQVGTGQDMTVQDKTRLDWSGQNRTCKEWSGHASHHHNNPTPALKQLGFDLIMISLVDI